MARKRATLGELRIGEEVHSLDDLTLGELEEFEDHMGAPLDLINLDSAKALRFLVWIVCRKGNPGFTLQKAGEIKIVDLMLPEDEEDAPEDPHEAAGEAAVVVVEG